MITEFQKLPTLSDIFKKVDQSFLGGIVRGEWTIYDHDSQKKIFDYDTFLGYQYTDESSIPTTPLENGGFSMANKINQPPSVRIRLAKSGIAYELNSFIKSLLAYKKSLKLVDVSIPSDTFIGYNIESISHGRQEGDSVSMIIAEISLRKVEQNEPIYTQKNSLSSFKIKNPADSSTVDNGRQQAKVPSSLYNIKEGTIKLIRGY